MPNLSEHNKKPLPIQRHNEFGKEFWAALDKTLEETFKTHQRKPKLELPAELLEPVITRPLSLGDLQYLQQLHPYLVIQNGEVEEALLPKGTPTLVRSDSGWLIHDFGEMLMTSAGHYARGAHPEAYELKAINDLLGEEGEDEEAAARRARRLKRMPARERAKQMKSTGTLVNQMVTTIKDMLGLIQKRWPSLKMMEGLSSMQRMMWVVSSLNDYPVQSFMPGEADQVVLEWAKRNGASQLQVKEFIAQRGGQRGARLKR